MNTYAQKTYQSNNLQSLSPAEQVARLLETAARHMLRAREHAEKSEFFERFHATEDAMRIIHGLQACLSDDPSAEGMRAVYERYYNNLTIMIGQFNVKNDLPSADEAITSLRTMATTWRDVDRMLRQQQATPPVPSDVRVDLSSC